MKSKTVAGLLAAFFGSFGAHKFYLGDSRSGKFRFGFMMIALFIDWPIVMIMLVMLSIIEAVALFSMGDQEFSKKFNNGQTQNKAPQRRRANPDFERKQRSEERVRRSNERSYERSSQSRNYRRPTPRPRENPFKNSGIKKFKDYDYDGAIVDFDKALEIDQNDVAVHFNIACAYSLTEEPQKAFYHLDKAVAGGFKDFERIKTHDALAFMRIQDEYDAFEQNQFRLNSKIKTTSKEQKPDEDLLEQLNKLNELKERGLLTQEEFLLQKEKLLG